MRSHWDIVIVGAGAAGLAAAAKLSRAGAEFCVLEARGRIGGRILTCGHRHPIELGAEFVHGRHPLLWRKIDDAGLRAVSVSGDQLCREGGKLRECEETEDDTGDLLLRADLKTDIPFSEYLDGAGVEPRARQRILQYVQGFNAADAALASTRALQDQQTAENAIEGDALFRLVDGYDLVLKHMSLGLPNGRLYLNAAVRQVDWRPSEARIAIESRIGAGNWTATARKVIVTVPAGVLQSGAIGFNPMPPATGESIAALTTGNVARVVLRFRTPFWERQDVTKCLSFLHAPAAVFPTWWTHYPVREPVLTAWAGGPAADRVLDAGRVVETAVESCAEVFGITPEQLRDELVSAHFHDWRADPFSLGAYAYVRTGALPAIERLARPVENTIYFAGEATDTDGH